ncbi:MAG: YdcF family protein [Candidatus Competibacteraceae bacterium]|nr:YdcF family protein [Candidatus Competibacteraceae bacterium]
MKPGLAPERWFARQRGIGWNGAAMLVLSNLVLLATAGLSGVWLYYRVWRIARGTPVSGIEGEWIVVLGARLIGDAVGPGYARRLRRAAALYRADPRRRVLLVGGPTGGAISEAECGREFLRASGIPAPALFVEDQSLNTLDNLRHARRLRAELRDRPFVLVTSRHHLARSEALARGLALHPRLCAAEDRLDLNPLTVWRLGREAYYLHWYRVGKAWSRWTGNRRNLTRIS